MLNTIAAQKHSLKFVRSVNRRSSLLPGWAPVFYHNANWKLNNEHNTEKRIDQKLRKDLYD